MKYARPAAPDLDATHVNRPSHRTFPGSGPGWSRLPWLAIALAAVVPPLVATFPPLYDYYHWVFQGHIVSRLLPFGPQAGDVFRATYELHWGPTPNLAAVLGIGLLSTAMPAIVAGRVFLTACVLVFGFGFARMTRAIQGRATAAEMLGFVWAYGFLTYRGYLSNLFSLGIAFFAIARLERATRPGDAGPATREIALLSAFGVAIYFCHLMGWMVFALVVAVHALASLWRGERLRSLRIAAVVVPSLPLLAWFALAEGGGSAFDLYDRLSEKIVAVVQPWMPFLRADPLPELLPTLVVSALVWTGLLALLLANVERRRGSRAPRPTLVAAGLFAIAACASPIEEILSAGAAGRPDERWAFAALLLLLASIRWRERRAVATAATVLLVLGILGYHAVEFRHASGRLRRIHEATVAAVPPGRALLSFTTWESPADPCADGRRASFGVPTLKWFDQMRLLEGDEVRSRIAETSLVRYRDRRYPTVDHWCTIVRPKHVAGLFTIRTTWRRIPVIVAYGCENGIETASAVLREPYVPLARGPGYAVFRGPDVEHPIPVRGRRRAP